MKSGSAVVLVHSWPAESSCNYITNAYGLCGVMGNKYSQIH